jgi:tetratricopeptide (TPR) repeat protein
MGLYSLCCVAPKDFREFRSISLFALFLASTLVIARAATPERSAQKLRSLAVLPVIQISVGVSVAEAEGPGFTKQELERQIRRLREALARNPSDGDRTLQLAEYLSLAELGEATNVIIKAVELLRARAEASPKDGETQAHFAKALSESGKEVEAERVLREAVKNASSNWLCWAGLGDRLDLKAWSILVGDTNKMQSNEHFLQQLSSLSSRELYVEQRNDVQSCRNEADKCFDRVKSLAPRDPTAALSRAGHLWQAAFTERVFLVLTGKEVDDSKSFFEIVSTPETCAAWADAARLTTTNYAAIGNWGWLEASTAFRKRGEGKPLDTLSPERRKNVLEAISLLEKLGEHPNPKIGAGAFEMLGVLSTLVMADANAGKAAFERSVKLDPERDGSWNGLALSAANTEDFQELRRICEERLKYDDSPLNRVLFAKTLDRIDLPTKAIEQANKAVALEPNNLLARLYAGALLLKHPDSADADSDMQKHFSKAAELLNAFLQTGKDDPLLIPYFLNRAIVLALDGRTDKAREILQKLGKKDIEEEKYKDSLRAIEMAIGN